MMDHRSTATTVSISVAPSTATVTVGQTVRCARCGHEAVGRYETDWVTGRRVVVIEPHRCSKKATR